MSEGTLREQRRAERVARERAQAAAATRRARLLRLAGAAGLAAVAVTAAVLVSSAGDQPSAASDSSATGDAAALVRGLPERGGVLGDPDAPVTVTEYVDLQCPVCAESARTILPGLVQDYVRTGEVKLAARTLHFLGPDSVRAARVAAGAERQGRLWPFLLAFYAAQGPENSGYATDEHLRDIAAAAGVDADRALGHARSGSATGRLERANADADRLGIQSTPTFTVQRGDGPAEVVTGGLGAALDTALAR